MQQLLVDLNGHKFSSPFAGQDIHETPFPFYEEFVVACAYTQNVKFVRQDTYNTHIKYIEEASFSGLTMRSGALERYPTHRG
jgi:hypothetical protein